MSGWFRFEEVRVVTGPNSEAVIAAHEIEEIVRHILEDRPLAERILGHSAWEVWQDLEGRYDLPIDGATFYREVTAYIRQYSKTSEPELLSGTVSGIVWRAAIGWRLEARG